MLMQQASPSNDSRPQVNTGGHILAFTTDSLNTATVNTQWPHTCSAQWTHATEIAPELIFGRVDEMSDAKT